ncbi:unknown [Mycoplasma sp. CAG:956]|nr:unknown [Mycoplasma sp. CAG:956]
MKYSVDEIIDDIIKLENLETREIIYINKSDIDFDIYENDILVLENNKYIKDDELKNKRVNMLKEKLERLKNSQFRE